MQRRVTHQVSPEWWCPRTRGTLFSAPAPLPGGSWPREDGAAGVCVRVQAPAAQRGDADPRAVKTEHPDSQKELRSSEDALGLRPGQQQGSMWGLLCTVRAREPGSGWAAACATGPCELALMPQTNPSPGPRQIRGDGFHPGRRDRKRPLLTPSVASACPPSPAGKPRR